MVSEINNTVIAALKVNIAIIKYTMNAYTLNLNSYHIRWTIGEFFCNFAMSPRPYNRPSTVVCEKLLIRICIMNDFNKTLTRPCLD